MDAIIIVTLLISSVVLSLLGIATFAIDAPISSLVFFSLSGLSLLTTKKFIKHDKIPSGLKLDNSYSKEIQDTFQKAVGDYQSIKKALATTKNMQLKYAILPLQNIAERLIIYLQSNPKQIMQASKFINYYQDRTATLVEECLNLEKTGLTTDNVLETLSNTINTLTSFQAVYEQQFASLLEGKLLDMQAETMLAQKTLQNAGITSSTTDKTDLIKQDLQQGYTPGRIDPNSPLSNNILFHYPTSSTLEELLHWGIFYPKRYNYNPETLSYVGNSRIIIGLSSFFLTTLGIPYFLLGKPIKAALCVLTSFTGIPFLLGIYNGVKYLKMDTTDFYNDYFMDKFNR